MMVQDERPWEEGRLQMINFVVLECVEELSICMTALFRAFRKKDSDRCIGILANRKSEATINSKENEKSY